MSNLNVSIKERLDPPVGRAVLAFYRGDVERRELTPAECKENDLWREESKLWVPKGWDGSALPVWGKQHMGPSPELVQAQNFCPETPLLIGEILSRPFTMYDYYNLVTTAGKGLLLDRLAAMGGPPSALTHMGVGNSATAAAVGDTQLLGSTPSPDLRAYDALPTRSGLVATFVRTYATGEGNMNWQEIGLFNGATNGTSILFNRIAPIGAFNKTSSVSIVATVTLTQS